MTTRVKRKRRPFHRAAKATHASAHSGDASAFLEELGGGPLTFGQLLNAIRVGDELSLVTMATKLGISRSHLCDIEKGRKSVSPARAAKFANILGYSERQFVELALQALVDEAGLVGTVRLDAA